jgi:hypothetical protein
MSHGGGSVVAAAAEAIAKTGSHDSSSSGDRAEGFAPVGALLSVSLRILDLGSASRFQF